MTSESNVSDYTCSHAKCHLLCHTPKPHLSKKNSACADGKHTGGGGRGLTSVESPFLYCT